MTWCVFLTSASESKLTAMTATVYGVPEEESDVHEAEDGEAAMRLVRDRAHQVLADRRCDDDSARVNEVSATREEGRKRHVLDVPPPPFRRRGHTVPRSGQPVTPRRYPRAVDTPVHCSSHTRAEDPRVHAHPGTGLPLFHPKLLAELLPVLKEVSIFSRFHALTLCYLAHISC